MKPGFNGTVARDAPARETMHLLANLSILPQGQYQSRSPLSFERCVDGPVRSDSIYLSSSMPDQQGQVTLG